MSTTAAAGFETRAFDLHSWQNDAVRSWIQGDAQPFRGTLEIFTGGGKTLIALACAEQAARQSLDFRLVVVTPTIALAEQWIDAIARYTTVARSEIGRPSRSWQREKLERYRVLVAVINTAAKMQRSLRLSDDTMLVVDECHRAGAPTFKSVLDIDARFKLGLSATPERDEVDDEGEPLRFDEQIVARRLGKVVFSFNLADARRAGWLPEYRILHHGLALHPDELQQYEQRSRRVDDLTDQLRGLGVEPVRARQLLASKGDIGSIARSYLAAVSSRKDLLFKARERIRIAREIIVSALKEPSNRIILFNERIESATDLYDTLVGEGYESEVSIEHSKLSNRTRKAALDAFRDGSARVLISAKSLIEGIDVPAATIGVSVASTASVRQRIQALGRVLRRFSSTSEIDKKAEMHVLYVLGTVDESIYEKEDWSDLTGDTLNEYFQYSLDPADKPIRLEGPPRRPKPTEEQEFERLAVLDLPFPTPWYGAIHGQEYRIDTRENVRNAFGTAITNSQGVGDMMRRLRGAPGGKFLVTPRHRFVLVAKHVDGETVWYAAGQLHAPFEAEQLDQLELTDLELLEARPGSEYRGPRNADNGRYKIRSRAGGSIERSLGRGLSQFAIVDSQNSENLRVKNATRVLEVWRATIGDGIEFFVNNHWHAWYRIGGIPRFLAYVPEGFEWSEGGARA